MAKSGRHKLVQVIKVNTIDDGMIWHPLPPDVMRWEQHSIILGCFFCQEYKARIRVHLESSQYFGADVFILEL